MRCNLPAQDWQIDFTHMPTHKNLQYLLTFVDTFSGWIEAFPTSRETADTVASLLTQEIIPCFSLPATIQSDNGPAFTAQVVQLVSKSLNISWKLHISYHPQSSGKVERAHGNTPIALSLSFRDRRTPTWQLLFSQVTAFSFESSNQISAAQKEKVLSSNMEQAIGREEAITFFMDYVFYMTSCMATASGGTTPMVGVPITLVKFTGHNRTPRPLLPPRSTTFLQNKTLILNISNPWNERWNAGVTAKLYVDYTYRYPQGTWLIFRSYTRIVPEGIEQLSSVSHTILENEATLTNQFKPSKSPSQPFSWLTLVQQGANMLNLTKTINLTHCFLCASLSSPPLAAVPLRFGFNLSQSPTGPNTTLTDIPLSKVHSQDFSLCYETARSFSLKCNNTVTVRFSLYAPPRGYFWCNRTLTKVINASFSFPFVPVTLVPQLESGGALDHDCEEMVDEVFASQPDLKDCPLPKADLNLFTNGSSYVQNAERYAGYAVTTTTEMVEAAPLPRGWSAQPVELHALIHALCCEEGKAVNIYTDSKYAFATVHIHGVIDKERGLLTAGGKEVKTKEEILRLLEAVWKPKEVAVIHCKVHQRGTDLISTGHQLADREAKAAELRKGPV
ncbi:Gag-Pol polyprotein [Plecturocebus cupreus]